MSTLQRKEIKSQAKVTQNMLAYMGIEPRQIPILAVYVQRLGYIRRPIPGMPDSLISWDLREPPPFSKEGITAQS